MVSLVGFADRADFGAREVIALRHQLAVLRRQRPGRTRPSSIDRLLWVWLYGLWPRCLNFAACSQRVGASGGSPPGATEPRSSWQHLRGSFIVLHRHR